MEETAPEIDLVCSHWLLYPPSRPGSAQLVRRVIPEPYLSRLGLRVILSFHHLICASLFTTRDFHPAPDGEFISDRSKLLFPNAERPSGSIPVILMSQYSPHPNGIGATWHLVVPFRCGKWVFQQFVRRGVRVFGLACSKLSDLEAEPPRTGEETKLVHRLR
jgi:hypothetical protein